jgi:hypothetical protein
VKEAKKELLQKLRCCKSILAQMAYRGMTTEGRKFWEETGNLMVKSALEEAEGILEKAGESQEAVGSPKALKANRDRLLYLIQ